MTTGNLSVDRSPSGVRRFFSLTAIQLVLLLMGTLVSGYLSFVQFNGIAMACVQGGAFNCEVVQSSAYARMFGIPIAYFGLVMYLVLIGLIALEHRVDFLREYGELMVIGISLFGWLFSMYLVYIQFFVLEALCPWCLAHEAIFTVFFGVTIVRYLRANAEA